VAEVGAKELQNVLRSDDEGDYITAAISGMQQPAEFAIPRAEARD
jgi:hypothetical protein